MLAEGRDTRRVLARRCWSSCGKGTVLLVARFECWGGNKVQATISHGTCSAQVNCPAMYPVADDGGADPVPGGALDAWSGRLAMDKETRPAPSKQEPGFFYF